jgi:hypothetical protein
MTRRTKNLIVATLGAFLVALARDITEAIKEKYLS